MDTKPPNGPIKSKAMIAIRDVVPLNTIGTVGGKNSEKENVNSDRINTPIPVMTTI
jgi:hypothetical protein